MSDEDEIEFLDEDADIVQQCVQIKIEIDEDQKPQIPLLVERTPSVRPGPGRPRKNQEGEGKVKRVRKRKAGEEDDDYDPTDDKIPRNRKRRALNRTPGRRKVHASDFDKLILDTKSRMKEQMYNHVMPLEEIDRHDLTIRVPDFDDPLCLPVRAIVKDDNDIRRLKHWNNLCLEQFKTYDKMLRPRDDKVTSSTRTVVIRNLFNKHTGKTEATFWSKMTVEDSVGETKTDVIQSVLPRYREKKVLNLYKLGDFKRHRPVRNKFEVILTKEKDGQDEKLVAYKSQESLALTFKMFQKTSKQYEGTEEENKNYLEEMASCKMCSLCYQTSWRGMEKSVKRQVNCQICGRSCVNIQNLFKHLKAHSKDEIKQYKRNISNSLAKVLAYHYKCRICQKQYTAIKDLRMHVREHKGAVPFRCEVGNHIIV